MTVKELKDNLEFYDDDAPVIFNLCDEVEVDSWTENKYGYKSVSIDADLRPYHIGEIHGDMNIMLEENR